MSFTERLVVVISWRHGHTTLRRKYNFHEICTGNYNFHHFQGHFWLKFQQNEDVSVSVYFLIILSFPSCRFITIRAALALSVFFKIFTICTVWCPREWGLCERRAIIRVFNVWSISYLRVLCAIHCITLYWATLLWYLTVYVYRCFSNTPHTDLLSFRLDLYNIIYGFFTWYMTR